MSLLDFVIVYMVIALAVMLYLPISRAQTARKMHDVSRERLELLTSKERKVLLYSLEGVERPLPTWTLVLGGLLWPTNLIVYIVAVIWGWVYARRVRRAESVVCLCPGCGQNLVNGHDVDSQIVPAGWEPTTGKDPEAILYSCGQCGVMSEWDLKTPIPALRRSVRPDISPMRRDDRAS